MAPALCQRAGEQDIGAPRGLDLVLLRQCVGWGDTAEHLIRLGSLDRTNRKALPQLVGERLQAQPDALLGDQPGGCIVHQEPVFDALHTGGNSQPDRIRRKRVRDDVGAPIVGYFNRGPQFGLGEGGDVERAVRRRHPAAHCQLDLGGSLHELFADANLIGLSRSCCRKLLHAGAPTPIVRGNRAAEIVRW
jgi:hypothetical protein